MDDGKRACGGSLVLVATASEVEEAATQKASLAERREEPKGARMLKFYGGAVEYGGHNDDLSSTVAVFYSPEKPEIICTCLYRSV